MLENIILVQFSLLLHFKTELLGLFIGDFQHLFLLEDSITD
jgi:hypothetical protein